MDRFKDLFSGHSADYSRFRPSYPAELFVFLSALCKCKNQAWDVGTGNGQAAIALAKHFNHVIATDPSAPQIEKAPKNPRVEYRVARAEESGLPGSSSDLVTVAQAFHWFDQERFYLEVKRVAANDAVLAVWCYELTSVDPIIDKVVMKLYKEILGPYWDGARKLVEEGYRNEKFPFTEIAAPQIPMKAIWTLEDFLGYLGTWSALQKYKNQNGKDPRLEVIAELEKVWGAEKAREVKWPLSLRVFRVN